MSSYAHPSVIPRVRPVMLTSIVLISLGVAQFRFTASAQTVAPVLTPTETPSPTAGPSPSPVDSSLYLPQASVRVASSIATPAMQGAKSGAQTAAADVPSQKLEVCVPDAFSITSVTSQAHTATVTLSYNAICAGSKMLVAPLDGGLINGTAGSKQILVGADGTVVFTFQTPDAPGLYNVIVMLGGYQRVMPFQMLGTLTPNGD